MPNQPSTTAGQQHASNAASSTPNEQSAATPPATPPRTDAGKTLYRLALKLTRITDLDHAATWVTHLHEFDHTYREWMNEKTTIKDPATGAYTKVYTHQRIRAAYQSLLSLHHRDLLFTYLQPPTNNHRPRQPCNNNKQPGRRHQRPH